MENVVISKQQMSYKADPTPFNLLSGSKLEKMEGFIEIQGWTLFCTSQKTQAQGKVAFRWIRYQLEACISLWYKSEKH